MTYFAIRHKGNFWLICTSQGELVIIQDDLDEFNNLIYSIYTNTPVERLAQLHNVLLMQPHNDELEQHLNNFVKGALFI